MIFMPPRHSKSETVTIHYSAYRILRDPSLNIIMASYNQKLANRFSRRTKRIAEQTGCLIRSDRRSAEEWETEAGGGVRAVGVGGGITGFGAGLILIDDPVKSRAHARSAAIRENTWEWFNDDVYTRLEPQGSIVLIQTRWHEDDLAGRLIAADRERKEWTIVSLPALAEHSDPLRREPGQALCPERFDEAALHRIKEQIGSHSFSALYQQDPLPAKDTAFRRSWFKIVDEAPAGLRWVRGYDLAVSTGQSSDHTASFRVAHDQNTGILYIADGFRARIEFPEQRRYITRRIAEEKNTRHCIESALHGAAFVQELRREVRFIGRPIRSVRVSSDKLTRANAWSARAEAGKVALVRGPWIEDFLDEVCRFPFGKHDDQVDAVSLAVAALGQDPSGAFGF